MAKNNYRLVIVAMLALAALALWQYRRAGNEQVRREKAELDTGLAASRVLTAVLAQKAVLRVATLDGQVVSRGECRSGYFFPNQQNTLAPYSVGYSLDLSRVDRASYRWNARRKMMFVELPDVAVEPPNIDLSRARSAQSGLFVSRTCGLAMQQQVADRLRAKADQRARRADYVVKARGWARAAVGNLVQTPLVAAGIEDVTVQVRFPGDPRPADGKAWDRSRSIDEVLAEPKPAS